MKTTMIHRSVPTCHSKDWKKVLSDALSDPLELLSILNLTSEQMGLGDSESLFPMRVPRPFVDRMRKGDPNDPLLMQVWPQKSEFDLVNGYVADPLNESSSNLIPGLLHKYKSRVLFICAASCAINCRYCFRRHFPYESQDYGRNIWPQWITYLNQHPDVSEVILSGGEPLLLSDSKLKELVSLFETIPHIKRIRIHTRLPVVIPQRITSAFLELANKSRLQWLMVWHINHPNEINHDIKIAAQKCADSNIQMLNQSVLLKDINDHEDILCELSEALFESKILPYYLHMLDPVSGAHHFNVTKECALKLHENMRHRLSGFLVPKLVQELPSRPSKTPIY